MAKKQQLVIGVLIIMFLTFIALPNFTMQKEQQFTYVAKALLQGKLYFTESPGYWYDAVYYQGHYYWPLGILPAVLLLPFVFISEKLNVFFLQGYLQFPLTILNLWLSYKLAKKFGFSNVDSLYLAFAFCFASVYQVSGIVSWSWHFAHVVTVALLLLALYEYFNKKRYLMIGTYMAFAVMTRFTAGIGVVFFLTQILFAKEYNTRVKVQNVCRLFLPILMSGIILLWLNYTRFDNPFNNGYKMVNNVLLTEQERFELLNYGLFQLRNIPTNLYYYFLSAPDPILLEQQSFQGNTYILKFPYIAARTAGVSFFMVGPIFLYIFRSRLRNSVVAGAFLAVVFTLFVLLTYFWPGSPQLGPRYTLDFLPFLYIILLSSFNDNELTTSSKILIIASAFFNTYLFLSS